MAQSEHDEQKTLIKWWDYAALSYDVPACLLFSVPNAAKRTLAVASMMRAEGLRAGVPDLFLACPKPPWSGLFIEMKRSSGGVLSDNQKTMIQILQGQGYAVKVCHGWLEARTTIIAYMENKFNVE